MSQPLLALFIDVPNRRLVASPTSSLPAVLPPCYQGDTLNCQLRFLDTTQSPAADIDYSAASVTVGVGVVGGRPASGTFTVTDTSATQTTSPLPYNSTAQQVQTAIQASLTTNWSEASVSGARGGPFTIQNGQNGSLTALFGTASMWPLSAVSINRLQAGSSSLPEMQTLSLLTLPVALQNTWTASQNPDVLSGQLALNTAAIEEAMGSNASLGASISIKVVPAGGQAFTVYQNNFTIQNDLIDGAPSIPTPGVEYYTTVESDQRYQTGLYVERNSTGASSQHITTTSAGANDVLFLLSGNTSGEVNFTFDNGTFDGQTLTYRTASSLSTITYSSNVSGVPTTSSIFGSGVSLSFMWDADQASWFPL